MHGWTGRLLRVNLPTRSTTIEEIDEKILHRYLGGRGLGAYLIYTEVPPHTDPLGPENPGVCPGAMTGMRIPTIGRSK
jgi:aldehyde:ferredoxin oxidoreductase